MLVQQVQLAIVLDTKWNVRSRLHRIPVQVLIPSSEISGGSRIFLRGDQLLKWVV